MEKQRKPMRHNHILNGKLFHLVHEKDAVKHVMKIVKDFNPEIIVEFGTGYGGTTLIFNIASPNAKIHSFDISINTSKPKYYNNNVLFYKENLLYETSKIVVKLLKKDKKKILYCDNGNKIQEVKMYSKYLNIGDMLGVHDWDDNGDREICYKDIKDELEGFKPINHEIFEKNDWSARFWIKEK